MTMQVSLHDVRQALEDLGRLRFGEMNIEDAIREIVHTTHSMFSVDGAGLMLCDAEQQLRGVAASDQRFAHLEELQIRHGEGPCIDAYDSKKLVGADDLTSDDRWPDFSQAAVSCSVRAVLASPLPYNQDAVGVVAVLSEKARPWSPEGELALLAFTDLAALLIATMMMGEQRSAISQQLQGALNSQADHRASQGRAYRHATGFRPPGLRAAAVAGAVAASQAHRRMRRGRALSQPGADLQVGRLTRRACLYLKCRATPPRHLRFQYVAADPRAREAPPDSGRLKPASSLHRSSS